MSLMFLAITCFICCLCFINNQNSIEKRNLSLEYKVEKKIKLD